MRVAPRADMVGPIYITRLIELLLSFLLKKKVVVNPFLLCSNETNQYLDSGLHSSCTACQEETSILLSLFLSTTLGPHNENELHLRCLPKWRLSRYLHKFHGKEDLCYSIL